MSFTFHGLSFTGGFLIAMASLLAWYPGQQDSFRIISVAEPTGESGSRKQNASKSPALLSSPSSGTSPSTFPVELSVLAENLVSGKLVPVLAEKDARALSLSDVQTAEINRLFAKTTEGVKEIESRHLLDTTDESGNPVVALLSWADEGEPLVTELVTALTRITTPQNAEFLAIHFVAPAFNDWGQRRQDFGFTDPHGRKGTFGILRQNPFQSGDEAPAGGLWGSLGYEWRKEQVEARYSHILERFTNDQE